MTENQKAPKQKLSKIAKNNLTMILKIARLSPAYFIGTISEGVIWGMINSAMSVMTLKLFDALDLGVSFSEIAKMILYMALFYTFAYAFDGWYWQYWQPLRHRELHNRLNDELFKKAESLDVSCYDDPEFYNDFVWAMDEASVRSNELLGDIGKLVNRIVGAGTLFTLLFTIDIAVAVILLVSSVMSIFINQAANKASYEEQKEQKPLARKRDYINRVYHLPDYAKELRTSRVSDLMMDMMDKNTEEMINVSCKYGKKYFVIYGIFNTLAGEVVYYAVLFYMFSLLVSGSILVGAFAATVGMIWRVRWLLSDTVEKITKFPRHSLFLEKYYGFLSYEPKVRSGRLEAGGFESLELKNVSFSYDFSGNPKYEFHEQDRQSEASESKDALCDVSLTLKKGEKIAIVGYNGAGKTTLIKLLLRLYDATEGEILYNGRNVREYKLDTYRDSIGTVFQDFRIFAASIAENVMNGEYVEERDKQNVIRALDIAGFSEKLSSLEDGIDTQLTREFDPNGTNLSGGESQKIAIARVFARPYELIIMDEPSSALDPIAEYELNKSIIDSARDKTVIFISHRLSTTKMADRIYMFDSGRLIESGSHNELMALHGKYAEMFELQAEKYRDQSKAAV